MRPTRIDAYGGLIQGRISKQCVVAYARDLSAVDGKARCDDRDPIAFPWLVAALVTFLACLGVRVAYVFYNGPLNHLFSDPNRHWLNGKRFFWPDLMGSIDPLVYQVWMKAVQWPDPGNGYLVLAATGVLSAALPVFWFFALRELLPLAWALAAAATIGFMPSLLMIYSYFMTETLLLVLVACGFWLTLRAMRTADLPTIVAVALVWALAAYTRVVALPLAGLALAALAYALPWRKRLLLAAAIAVCFGAIALPACWHSSKNLRFCAPFGSGYFNEIYRASGAQTLRMNVQRKGEWFFTPRACTPCRSSRFRAGTPPHRYRADRDRSGARSPGLGTGRRGDPGTRTAHGLARRQDRKLGDVVLRSVVAGFEPGIRVGSVQLLEPLAVAARDVAGRRADARRASRPRDGLIPASALALIALLLVQTSGVMEGRYRKPVEPLLVAGAFVLLHRARSDVGRSKV